MTVAAIDKLSFAYSAQTQEAQPISGTIEAQDLEDATRQLRALGLRVIEIALAQRPARVARLSGEDFLAFNQQLAHLTQAGLPVEHGLRLIAQDMRHGRLARTVNQLADELHRGSPLPEAFDKFKRQFPPLYARLVEAGIKSNNLGGMLLNLGRHVEMVHRLRASLWRASAYPMMILLALVAILLVLSLFVLPQIGAMYDNLAAQRVLAGARTRWGRPVPSPSLPGITTALINFGNVLPIILVVIGGLIVAIPVLWTILRWIGLDRAVGDALLLPLPLIGPVLKRNLVARWVDALQIGISAGMDLPAAIEVASDAVGSPRLRHDSYLLTTALQSGRPLTEARPLKLLPPAVPAAIELGSQNRDLSTTLETLSRLYQQQAEMRLRIIPVLLTPLLLLLVAGSIGFVMAALLLPIFRIIQYITW